MEQKKVIIEALKDIVIDFEESSKIENYAIAFDERIVLGPNATSLTKETAAKILNKVDLEKYEVTFQRGVINLISFEFENEVLYYLRCTPKVRIISLPQKEIATNARIMLVDFAEKVRETVEPLYQDTNKEDNKDIIVQMLTSLEKMVEEFEIPKFEEYKKLVKFAVPFKKKEKN
jgi:hypothetical protein